MANKALAKRQKMTIRAEPSQKAGKPHKQPVPKQRTGTGSGGAQAPSTLRERLLKRFSS